MSATTVVNVKVQYIRPRYESLKEWCEDESNVYIGRGGVVFITDPTSGKKERYPKESSIFANPFKLPKGVDDDASREKVVEMYRGHILTKLENGEIKWDDVRSLRGKNLGCWCKSPTKEVKCHGDVLLELCDK